MPCYDSRDWCSSGEIAAYQHRLDDVTRMLCDVITYLREREVCSIDSMASSVVGLASWIKKHDELDRLRAEANRKMEKQQQLKQQALGKLTPEERQVLGVEDIIVYDRNSERKCMHIIHELDVEQMKREAEYRERAEKSEYERLRKKYEIN